MKTFVLVAFVASAAFGLASAAGYGCSGKMQMMVNAMYGACETTCETTLAKPKTASNTEEVTNTMSYF